MAQPSQVPARFTSGVSVDYPHSLFGHMGIPNPFFYQMWADDFHTLLTEYTATKTGNGTIATSAGAGGRLTFTTNSSTPAGGDLCSIQLPSAAFVLVAGKKAFFACRLQLSSATNAAFRVGLVQTTTTPFTATDGIYIDKATGSLTNINLVSVVSSTATTVAIPTTAYTLANSTYIDVGWYLDRSGTINAFVGDQLVGWLPQAGTGTGVGNRGAVAASTPTSLPSATLNPTVAIASGTAASSSMIVDFAMVSMER